MNPDYFLQLNNNSKIAIYDKGSKNNNTIVFVHGNSLGACSFNEQFTDPSLSSYRLISFDLPGHGHSSKAEKPEAEYSISGYTNAIAQIIQFLEVKNIIFAGHSFGGHLLMEGPFLTKDIMAALLIFGSPPMQYPPVFNKMFLPHEAGGLIFEEDLNNNEINTMAAAFVKKQSSANLDLISSIKNTDPRVRKFLGLDIMAGNSKDEVNVLSKANIPIAIFHGTEDQLVNVNYYKELVIPSLWENKIHLIKEAGHCIQFEKPKTFNKLLKKFCDFVYSFN